jgi:hypothetical protein
VNDSDGRLIRYYLVKVRGELAIWEASDSQVLKMLKENPGSELIGTPHLTRADARAAARRYIKSK